MGADFGYTGDYYHAPSQLCLTKYREYAPNLGRWASRDPMPNSERTEGPNLYRYVHGNPIIGIDPRGLGTWSFGYDDGGGNLKMAGPGQPLVTYNMDSTQRQCCQEAVIVRYVWSIFAPDLYKLDEETPGDGSAVGYYRDPLAYSSGDAPTGKYFGFAWLPTNYSFEFTVRCTKGKCQGNDLDMSFGMWHANGGFGNHLDATGYWVSHG